MFVKEIGDMECVLSKGVPQERHNRLIGLYALICLVGISQIPVHKGFPMVFHFLNHCLKLYFELSYRSPNGTLNFDVAHSCGVHFAGSLCCQRLPSNLYLLQQNQVASACYNPFFLIFFKSFFMQIPSAT